MNFNQLLSIIDTFIFDLKCDRERINAINQIKVLLHKRSPLSSEPIDCVLWVKNDLVKYNDYNPNVIASPEKKLLAHSLFTDGFTQPVVVSLIDNQYVIIDGCHRKTIGKTTKFKEKLKGYLPVVCVKSDERCKSNHIASTIRHNRARGKNKIDSISNVVRELSIIGWSDDSICKELGMDKDEVLRLKQISGLIEVFGDHSFSQSWTIKES